MCITTGNQISPEDVLTTPCDVLVPAAIGGVLTKDVAAKVALHLASLLYLAQPSLQHSAVCAAAQQAPHFLAWHMHAPALAPQQ